MRNVILKLIFVLLIAAPSFGCRKLKTYPVVPAIQFYSIGTLQNITRQDSLAVITVSFTDGDGDIGLTSSDTLPPFNPGSIYYYDFIVHFFELRNGVWVKDTVDEQPGHPGFSGRIPYLTPDGSNKELSGDISMNEFIPPTPYDTVQYTVYIYDRALHQSNTITTAAMVINAY